MTKRARSHAGKTAFTLVETILALSLSLLVLGLAMSLLRQAYWGSRKVDRQVSRAQELMLLREILSWDLTRCCPPELFNPNLTTTKTRQIRLDLLVAETTPDRAVHLTPVTYAFDHRLRCIVRNGKPLRPAKLYGAQFTVAAAPQPILDVLLEGPKLGEQIVLTFPLPASFRGLSGWSPAFLSPVKPRSNALGPGTHPLQ